MCLIGASPLFKMRSKQHFIVLLLVIFSLLVAVSESVAQIKDKPLSTSALTLPAWISDFKQTATDVPLVFGIADPGLSSAMAYDQAYHRALMLAKLMHKAQIGIYTSQYEALAENKAYRHLSDKSAKYVRFYRIQNQQTNYQPMLRLVDSTSSFYGEKILLFEIHPAGADTRDTNRLAAVTIDFLNMEFNAGKDYTRDSFYAFQSADDTSTMEYLIYKTDEISAIESVYNDKKLDFPFDYYKYLPTENAANQHTTTVFNGEAKLYYGLWKAYLEALAQAYTGFYGQTVNLETIQDTYKDKTLKLNQLTETKSISARLSAIKIGQNELKLKLDFIESNQH